MGKSVQGCDCNIIHNDIITKCKNSMLDDDVLLSMADFYKALSDSTRIKIINALANNELCVCDIASLLNMTKSAVSHQLGNLKEMYLIKSKKIGREVWYSLADDHVLKMFDLCKEHILEALSEKNY